MIQQDSNQQFFRLIGQFFLTHFVVGLIAWFASELLPRWSLTYSWQSVAIVGGLAGAVGVLLTLNIVWSIQLVDVAISRLMRAKPVGKLSWYGQGGLAGLLGKLQKLGERERPFAHLRQQNLQQAQQAAAQEERNRLARDLHDSIKQQLFSISMSSAAVEARWEHDPDGARASLVDVRQSTQAALVEMNALLQQLAPAPLAQVGFVEALKEQCLALQYRSGAEVMVEIGALPDNGRLPPNTQETLFRVAQEALSNIARHARANTVYVQLFADEVTLSLTIQDDGQGFEPKQTGGRGLQNMAERIDRLNAEWHLTTKPDKGTQIQIKVPLIQTEQEQEMMETDNIFNRLSGLILGGAIGLIALLAYPLYGVWPKLGLPEWSDGSTAVSSLLLIPAILLVVGLGYMAGRMAGSQRRSAIGWGALVGGSASLLLFYGLAGATASVWGNADMFTYELLAPTVDEFAGVGVIGNSVVNIIWAVNQWLWICLLAGVFLGGLGGTFAPLRAEPLRWDKLVDSAQAIGVVLMLCSIMSLFISVAIHALLPDSLRTASVENNFTFQQPVWGVEFWPIFTPTFLYCLANGFLLWLGEQERFQDTSWYRLFYGYLLSTLNLMLAILVTLLAFDADAMAENPSYAPYFWIVIALSVIWYVLFGLQTSRLWHWFDVERPTAVKLVHLLVLSSGLSWLLLIAIGWVGLGLILFLLAWGGFFYVTTPHYEHRDGLRSTYSIARVIESLGGSVVMFTIGSLPVVPHALGLVLLTIPYIRFFVDGETNDIPAFTTQIQALFRVQLWSLGITLLLATFMTGLLVIGVRIAFGWTKIKEKTT